MVPINNTRRTGVHTECVATMDNDHSLAPDSIQGLSNKTPRQQQEQPLKMTMFCLTSCFTKTTTTTATPKPLDLAAIHWPENWHPEPNLDHSPTDRPTEPNNSNLYRSDRLSHSSRFNSIRLIVCHSPCAPMEEEGKGRSFREAKL